MGSFTLAPGSYEMHTELRESESGKAFTQVRKMNVPNYAATPFSVSDIMLVNHVTTEGGQSTIVPNVSGNLYDLPHGFPFFFEVYNRTGADSVILTYQVFDKKKKPMYSHTERRRLDGKKIGGDCRNRQRAVSGRCIFLGSRCADGTKFGYGRGIYR